jgi:hypothetical protein
MAATKALDDLYGVDPPTLPTEFGSLSSIFMVEDHALHFFFLAGRTLSSVLALRRPIATSSGSSGTWGSRSAER